MSDSYERSSATRGSTLENDNTLSTDLFVSGSSKVENDNEDLCTVKEQEQSGLLDGGWVVTVQQKSKRYRSTTFHCIKSALCGWMKRELIAQMKLCFPIILTWLFQNLLAFVSLIFVGHISGRALELDSVALATSFINVTGVSIGIGLSSAADTLCSQTFGFKNYKRVGHILQQGILILLVVCLFVWGFWLNTDSLLLLLQQPPCIARYASYYTMIFSICLPPFYVYVMLQKYLQAQSRVWPFIIVGALANVVNLILHAVLLLVLGLGIIGAAISMVISNIAQPIFLLVYLRVTKIHKLTWGGWSWVSLQEWWQFLKLGIPGMAMICLEWTSYEIVVFVLGSIGEVELAINSIIVNLLVIMFMLPLGISITGGIRVGNHLGAGDPKAARRTAYASLLLVVVNAILELVFLQSIKDVIASFYTEEEAVLQKLPLVVNIITPGLFFDQVQLVIQGILRGCGLQTLGAVINFIAFYFLGLPLGISLAFCAKLGVVGVWIGLGVATTAQCIVYFIIVITINWTKQAKKAQERAGAKQSECVAQHNTLDNDTSTIPDKEDMIQLTAMNVKEEVLISTVESLTEEEEKLLEENVTIENSNESVRKHYRPSSHVKLLLSKTSLFILGAVFVIIVSVLGHQLQVPEYILNGNYSQCTDDGEQLLYDIVGSSSGFLPSI